METARSRSRYRFAAIQYGRNRSTSSRKPPRSIGSKQLLDLDRGKFEPESALERARLPQPGLSIADLSSTSTTSTATLIRAGSIPTTLERTPHRRPITQIYPYILGHNACIHYMHALHACDYCDKEYFFTLGCEKCVETVHYDTRAIKLFLANVRLWNEPIASQKKLYRGSVG